VPAVTWIVLANTDTREPGYAESLQLRSRYIPVSLPGGDCRLGSKTPEKSKNTHIVYVSLRYSQQVRPSRTSDFQGRGNETRTIYAHLYMERWLALSGGRKINLFGYSMLWYPIM
jgi:hypothetical protein